MCEYVNNHNCSITGQKCPYMYWCYVTKKWLPNKNMPKNCFVKEQYETPKGYYRVCFESKGKLYIDVDNQIVVLNNPFDEIPKYVKLAKNKKGWKVRK